MNPRGESDLTPLRYAAIFGTPEAVIALLNARADVNAEGEWGRTPWDLANDNIKLKGTDAYWALNDARFE